MREFSRLVIWVALFLWPSHAFGAAELEFDHLWIVVTRNAPERVALERAGLKISPGVNRNDGQGTASVSAEFLNSYIELMWPDPSVSVAASAQRGVEKFKNRMNWRTSGWCPIGVAVHRTGPGTTLPFPTWTIAPTWMPAGSAIEILTPREDTKSPSFFIEPPVLAVKEKANRELAENDSRRASFQHPIGVERITGIRIVRPKGYQSIAAFTIWKRPVLLRQRKGMSGVSMLPLIKGERHRQKICVPTFR